MRTMLAAVVLAAVVLAAAALPAHAEWDLIARTTNQDSSFYIDWATLKSRGATRTVWTLMDSKKPTVVAYSNRELVEVDCKEGRQRFLQRTWFTGQMGTGDVAHQLTNGEWKYVEPGSVAEIMHEDICKRSLK